MGGPAWEDRYFDLLDRDAAEVGNAGMRNALRAELAKARSGWWTLLVLAYALLLPVFTWNLTDPDPRSTVALLSCLAPCPAAATFLGSYPVTREYYPAEIAIDSSLAKAAKIRGGAPQALADLGFPQRALADRISARPPTVEEAETLDLPAGTPVIRQLRVIYSDNERPVEASVLIKGAHLYELLYRQTVETELG